jgi:hypothetical protein
LCHDYFRLSDCLENALPSRLEQNSKYQEIRREKRDKRRNTHKKREFADEIGLSQIDCRRHGHCHNRQ